MLLRAAENRRVIDLQQRGFFTELYEPYGVDVPPALLTIELLAAGQKVMAERASKLLFTGTIRDRPNGFLPPEVLVVRNGSSTEEIIISLPLHYYGCDWDGYGNRIIGGGGSRHWVELGKIVLRPDALEDVELQTASLTVGEQGLSSQVNRLEESVRVMVQQLIDQAPDNHRAHGGIGFELT